MHRLLLNIYLPAIHHTTNSYSFIHSIVILSLKPVAVFFLSSIMQFLLLALAGTALATPVDMPQVKLTQRSTMPSMQTKRNTTMVSGTAEGFAAAVTGGGSADPVYPDTIDELTSYLSDDEARVIVLTKTFDYSDSEGTATSSGCSPWGTASGCQTAIDQNSWCENYEPDAPTVSSITYNAAGVEGLTVNSDKTILGQGTAGVIKGKGYVQFFLLLPCLLVRSING